MLGNGFRKPTGDRQRLDLGRNLSPQYERRGILLAFLSTRGKRFQHGLQRLL